MFILGGCGWIPDATVQFIANIVDAIKILTPIILVIMGAIDFGKAVMSQQEDQIKKSQSAFIQKLIAGAAVFFVISFIGWILKLINQADASLNAGTALSCLDAMLNGGYSSDTVTRRTTTKKSTTSTTTKLYNDCVEACKKLTQEKEPGYTYCLNERCPKITTTKNKRETCKQERKDEIQTCISTFKDNTASAQYCAYEYNYRECEKDFKEQGSNGPQDFANACYKYEICMINSLHLSDDYICTSKNANGVDNEANGDCSTEYKTYKYFVDIYNHEFTSNPEEYVKICQDYAQRMHDQCEANGGSATNETITNYCIDNICGS